MRPRRQMRSCRAALTSMLELDPPEFCTGAACQKRRATDGADAILRHALVSGAPGTATATATDTALWERQRCAPAIDESVPLPLLSRRVLRAQHPRPVPNSGLGPPPLPATRTSAARQRRVSTIFCTSRTIQSSRFPSIHSIHCGPARLQSACALLTSSRARRVCFERPRCPIPLTVHVGQRTPSSRSQRPYRCVSKTPP